MKSVYDIVTESVIERLKEGVVPWRKPWRNYKDGRMVMNQNYITKKEYRGINQFLLNCSEYLSPYWMTFKQISDSKFKLKKGAQSAIVCFFKPITETDADELEEEVEATKFMFRYYYVFNTDCVEGLEHLSDEFKPEALPLLKECEDLSSEYLKREGIALKTSLDKACYNPTTDTVTMPHRDSFESIESYYSCLFHELTHSTGSVNRLKRFEVNASPSMLERANEELVAELGQGFLCGHFSIYDKVEENTAAYIQSWLRALENDSKLVVFAASKAQKAYEFILVSNFN